MKSEKLSVGGTALVSGVVGIALFFANRFLGFLGSDAGMLTFMLGGVVMLVSLVLSILALTKGGSRGFGAFTLLMLVVAGVLSEMR